MELNSSNVWSFIDDKCETTEGVKNACIMIGHLQNEDTSDMSSA